MSRTNLENAIQQAANDFALKIIDAVKGATLQELIALQSREVPKKLGRKPGSRPGPKPGRKSGPKTVRKKKVQAATKKVAAANKKRVVRNYPKCAYPGCENNRFVRGKGFCGEHWREWKAGKIKAASKYKK